MYRRRRRQKRLSPAFLRFPAHKSSLLLMGCSAHSAVVTYYSTYPVCWKKYMASVLRHLTTHPFSLLSLR